MYHWIFPNLNKLIFMDVDLDIHTDIKVLFQQFSEFNSSNIIGVGYDLSPHYRLNLEQYRKWHPGSTLGDPGPTQVNREHFCKKKLLIPVLGFQHGCGFV